MDCVRLSRAVAWCDRVAIHVYASFRTSVTKTDTLRAFKTTWALSITAQSLGVINHTTCSVLSRLLAAARLTRCHIFTHISHSTTVWVSGSRKKTTPGFTSYHGILYVFSWSSSSIWDCVIEAAKTLTRHTAITAQPADFTTGDLHECRI